MDAIQPGWFSEISDFWPGQALSLRVRRRLLDKTSKYQHVEVFESERHGNVLVLDGAIQVTEFDEFAYQEMISHVPLSCHPNPEQVLVVGGGDGGVLREVVKDPRVKKVTLCEIDEEVIEASKKYLPSLAVGFDHPKVSVAIQDGTLFLDTHVGEFDVIITDASDPSGPGESLFQKLFFQRIAKALKPGGVICCQAESPWLHMEHILRTRGYCQEVFKVTEYVVISTPTYPSGLIGFLLCGTSAETDFRKPIPRELIKGSDSELKYYNAEVHQASFAMPEFVKQAFLKADEAKLQNQQKQ